jgi:CHAT domain-containing protein
VNRQIRNIISFLFVFVVFFVGCGKDKNTQITDADNKLSEGQALMRQSEYATAEVILREAIDLNMELKRDSVLGEIYLLINQCQRWNGSYDSIPGTINRAIEYYKAAGAQKGIRRGLTELARYYFQLEDYQKSMAIAAEAAVSAKILRDTTDLLDILSISVNAARSLNRFEQTIRYARDMYEVDSVRYKTEYRSKISESLFGMFYAAGKSQDMHNLINDLEKDNDVNCLLRIYTQWGELYYRNGNLDSALSLFSQGLMYIDKQTESNLKIKLLLDLGSVAYRTKHYDNARMYFLDALSSAKENGNISLKRVLEGILIACDWKYSDPLLRQYRKEFVSRDSALIADCTSENNKYGEMLGLAITIRLAEEGKDTLDTRKLSDQLYALETSLEDLGDDKNIEPRLLNLFLDGELYTAYTGILQAAVHENNHNRIIELLEEDNIRDLGRFFSRLTIDTQDAALNDALVSYRNKYFMLNVLRKDIEQEIAKGKNSNQKRLNLLRNLYSSEIAILKNMVQDIWRSHRNFGRLLSTEPPSILSIRDSISTDEAVTEFFRVRDTLYFMIMRNDTSYIIKGTQSASKILVCVTEYNKLIGDSRSADNQVRGQTTASSFRIDELSRTIGEALIAPLRAHLNGVKNLFVVPPYEYGMLPFHTLRSGSAYLAEDYNVHYIPTAAALLMSHRETGPIVKVAAVGYPGSTNWDIEYELRDIRSFFEDAGMIFNQDATLPAIDDLNKDVLHIGAEFVLDKDYPDNTTCVLSGGKLISDLEYVPIGKLLNINNPQVLIISSISQESGVLNRYVPLLFIARGTPTVIATMWRGDRRLSRAFGEGFYTALKEGKQVDEAYNSTVRKIIGQPEFSKPQQWGMYYLIGR